MSSGSLFNRPVSSISAALVRFPVPALLSVLCTIYANLDVAGIVADGDEPGNYVYRACAAAFFASMAGHNFAQSRSWSRLLELLFALAMGTTAGALIYFTSLSTSQVYLFAGLIPLLMIAGFLRREANEEAVWLFSLRMVLAALLATIVGIIFFLCLSDVISGIEFFGANLSWGFEGHITETVKFLLGPICFLSLAPGRTVEDVSRASWLEGGPAFLANYAIAPIAIAYAAILHAYAAKAAIEGTLPDSRIAWLAIIFLLGPIALWIVAWPWRLSEGMRSQRYIRGWIWLSVVPVILLALAIWERISAYGLTPNRYGVAVSVVWVAFIALYLAFRRDRADLRILLGSFGMFALAISTGPWGATSLSVSSQASRLVAMLEAQKALTPDGQVVSSIPPMSSEDKEAIYAALDGLNEMDGLDRIAPLFSGRTDNPFASDAPDTTMTTSIAEILKLYDPAPSVKRVNFRALSPALNDVIVPGRLVGPIAISSLLEWTKEEREPVASASAADGVLTIKLEGQTWSTPLKPLLEKLQTVAATYIMRPSKSEGRRGPVLSRFAPIQPVLYEIEPGLKLILTDADGSLGDQPLLNSATFWVILQQ